MWSTRRGASTVRLLATCASVLVVLWWWRRRPFRVAVQGGSMAPELEPGDWVVAVRRAVRRGSVVVVEHPWRPGFEVVKRVAALPGETVAGRKLGPGELWVVGDHAPASTDSRTFGPVPAAGVKGVVRLRYGPRLRPRMFPP